MNEILAAPRSQRWHWSTTHLEALARLEHFVAARWPLAVMSGASGTGKSSIARFFAEQMRRSGREALFVDAGFGDFEAEVAREMRTNGSALEALRSRVATEEPFVLVVDHATPRTETWLGFVDAVLRSCNDGSPGHASVLVIGDHEHLVREWGRCAAALRVDVEALGAADIGAFVKTYFQDVGSAVRFDDSGIATLRSLTEGIPRQLEVLLQLALSAEPTVTESVWGSREVESIALETGMVRSRVPARI